MGSNNSRFCKEKHELSLDRKDLYYKMDHRKRGTALIFNNIKFNSSLNLPKRISSNSGGKRMANILTKLGFKSRIYKDLTCAELDEVLSQVISQDHCEEDCLVIVVMTYGAEGNLYAKDHFYHIDDLWAQFVGNKCPTLAGKPKLIFVQADAVTNGANPIGKVLPIVKSMNTYIEICKTFFKKQIFGYSQVSTDSISFSRTENNNNEKHCRIPVMSDILVMYSSGSKLIQNLCAELEDKADHYSLQDILVFTTRRIADLSTLDLEKIPITISQLRSLLVFEKKK